MKIDPKGSKNEPKTYFKLRNWLFWIRVWTLIRGGRRLFEGGALIVFWGRHCGIGIILQKDLQKDLQKYIFT